MTYHSKLDGWMEFVKKDIGGAANFAALLNVTSPTARKYISQPQSMSVEQVYILSIKTDTEIKNIVKLILLH